MTGTPSMCSELLAECKTHGIELFPTGDGQLTIDGPRDVLTPGFLNRLRQHKVDLLAHLQADDELESPEWYDTRPGEGHDFEWVDDLFQDTETMGTLRTACQICGKYRWWTSIYGDHLICGFCHPPATPEVFREWVLDL